jgi:hypothetical protein
MHAFGNSLAQVILMQDGGNSAWNLHMLYVQRRLIEATLHSGKRIRDSIETRVC